MSTAIVCVGKLKTDYLRAGCAEFATRLTHYYSPFEIQEVPDFPDDARAPEREGEKILSFLRPGDRVVALAIQGDMLDSEAFAKKLYAWQVQGGRTVWIIGGSTGLSQSVLSRAQHHISFSKMTFPHQLMRLILLEQLYRAAKINAHESYHK